MTDTVELTFTATSISAPIIMSDKERERVIGALSAGAELIFRINQRPNILTCPSCDVRVRCCPYCGERME